MNNLGKKAKDRITGFKGIIVAHVNYLTGCSQYGITPKVDKEGKTQDTNYFDVHRVEILGEGVDPKSVKDNSDLGGPNRDKPTH